MDARQKHIAVDLFVITTAFAGMILLINPSGDFPLNDDWSYALTVKRMHESGFYRPIDWTSTTFLAQAVWGWLFVELFHFSFEVLRYSTILLSFLGLYFFYFIIRRLTESRFIVLVATGTMASCPLYLPLSNSFMTDVPFSTFVLASIFFISRYFQCSRWYDLVLASFFVCVSILVRHIGLFIPLAFFFSWIGSRNQWRFRELLVASIPVVISFAVLFSFNAWLAMSGNTPKLYSAQTNEVISAVSHPWNTALLKRFLGGAYPAILYFGWFLSPLLLISVRGYVKKYGRLFLISLFVSTSILFGVMWVASLVGIDFLMPLSENVIVKSGVGPASLRDSYLLGHHNHPVIPDPFWFTLTLLSTLSAAVLISIASVSVRTSGIKDDFKYPITLFFLMCIAIYMFPLFLTSYMDRYLFPPAMILIMVIAVGFDANFEHNGLMVSVSTLVVLFSLASFSIFTTKDYLSWNRARWEAIKYLKDICQAKPNQVDGGFEFNGLEQYSSDYSIEDGKSWWWVYDDLYVLSFGPIEGYHPIRRFQWTNYFPYQQGQVLILMKNL